MERFDNYQCFLLVAKLGSFSQAAKQLQVAPSSVSRQIAAMEKYLQVQLFHRTTRVLQLTDAGHWLLEKVQPLVNDFADIESQIRNFSLSPKGLITITTAPLMGRYLLTPLLAKFRKRFPDIHFKLIVTDQNLNLLEEGVDLAFRAGQLKDSTLKAVRLGLTKLRVVASPNYLEHSGRPDRLEQLADLAWVVNDQMLNMDNILQSVLPDGNLHRFKTSLVADDLQLILEATVQGLGVTVLPDYLVDPLIQKGSLVQLLPELKIPSRDINLVFPSSRFEVARVRLLIDFLKGQFGE